MSAHTPEKLPDPPGAVADYAAEVVEYVKRALDITLEYDSDTLPVLDHYLRNVPQEQEATMVLVACTAGAYFGEVVRRRLGGTWDLRDPDPSGWRFELPGGLSFAPAGMVLAAIRLDDEVELDSGLRAPAPMRPHLEAALERMGAVTEDTYYSLCGRLDTLEHLQAVLLAVAARERKRRRTAN